MIKEYVDVLLKDKDTHSLIIVGMPGLGKSSEIIKCLKDAGLERDTNFIYNTGFTTPLAMFRLLEMVQNLEDPKVVVFDDVDNLLTNKICLGILKGATAEVDGIRTVSYLSTRNDSNFFTFGGKVIIILNKVPKNVAIDAIIDRSILYKIELKKDELEEYIEDNLMSMYPTLSNNEKLDVWNKIKIFNGLENFSFRTVKRAFAMFQNNKDNWMQLFKKSLIKKQ